jgi:hypothetical protein
VEAVKEQPVEDLAALEERHTELENNLKVAINELEILTQA